MSQFPSPSLAISVTALVISLGGAGYSATGGNFILGNINSANRQTKLIASIANSALRVENPTDAAGAAGVAIITDADRPPLVVTSEVRVATLNADFLDGIDSREFGRILAMDSAEATATLTAGDKFVLVDPFTPVLSGECLVSVTTQIDGTDTSGIGPYYRAAVKRGNAAPLNDNDHGDYFLSVTQGYSPEMTRVATFEVNAQQVTRFGAFFGDIPGSWVGRTAEVRVTYLCMTRGTLDRRSSQKRDDRRAGMVLGPTFFARS